MPTATRSTIPPSAQNESPSTSTTPTRKIPRCSKCQRPRAGHPRSGCPFADAQATGSLPKEEEDEDSGLGGNTSAKGRRKLEDVSNALSSMHLRSTPVRDDEEPEGDKAITRDRRRKSRPSGIPALKPSDTLLSLNTSSQELVETLLRPGAFDDHEEDTEPEDSQVSSTPTGKAARIIKWQETLRAATPKGKTSPGGVRYPRSSPDSPMPGTLIVPNASFFQSHSSIDQDTKPSSTEVNYPTSPSSCPASLVPTPKKTRGKPLARSMSMEQREEFLARLGPVSSAVIHVLPKADIHTIADAARDLGFIASVATNENEEDEESLLILGRDEGEVAKLLGLVQRAEDTKTRHASSKDSATEKPRSSAMKVAAGGVVAGAVGTWMGLAFS
ncbi:hypothetical protein BKA70DRAFT_1557100 [Coprinopsis sp. MPI-PUGE-AT-0042]|nr:hypothetical protein BKA70DRAFT_1557100 [Coprinopsis sp. MPI-PUGE-AT-0042]